MLVSGEWVGGWVGGQVLKAVTLKSRKNEHCLTYLSE